MKATKSWLVAAITLGACAVRLWGIAFGLPYPEARPDETAVVGAALGMLQTGPNPHFFVYPTFFLYVLSALFWMSSIVGRFTGWYASPAFTLGEPSAAAHWLLFARVVVAVIGTATVPLLYNLVGRLFSTQSALIAATLLAVSFLHVRDSHFGVTDVPMAFMIVLALWVVVAHPLDWSHRANVFRAAVVCGLAASTKYNAIIVIAPLVVATVQQQWASRHWPALLISPLLIGLGAGVGFVVGTPYAIFDYAAVRNALAATSLLLEGHAGLRVGYGWIRHFTVSLWYGVGWPMLLAALAGVVLTLVTNVKRAVVLLAFPISYYTAMGAGQAVFVRYMDPVVPFVCALAAFAIWWLAVRIERAFPSLRAVATAVLLACAAAGLSAARVIAFDRLATRVDTRVAAANWLEQSFPAGATFYQLGGTYARLELPATFRSWTYDPSVDLIKAPSSALPSVVIVFTSPLRLYTPSISDLAKEVLRARYRSVKLFEGESSHEDRRSVYDEQDAFFLPLSGFEVIRAPGPTIEVFEFVSRSEF